jgi:hypothetical protein
MIRQALGLLLLALVAMSSCLPSQRPDSDESAATCTLQTTSLYDDITGDDADKAKTALETALQDSAFKPRDEAVAVVFWGLMAQLSRDGVLDDAFFDLDMAGELSRVAMRYPSVFVPCGSTSSVQQSLSAGCVFQEAKECIKSALMTYLGKNLPKWGEIQTAGMALIKFVTTMVSLKEKKQLTIENLDAALTGEDKAAIVNTMVGGIGIAGILAGLVCATNPFCAGVAAAATFVGLASLAWKCGTAAKVVITDQKCGCFFTICQDGLCECDEPLNCPNDCKAQEPGVPICMQGPGVTCCTCGGTIFVEGEPGFWEVVQEKLCRTTLPMVCDPNTTPEMVTREVAIQNCWQVNGATPLDAADCCGKYGGYVDTGAKENCGP